MECSECGVAGSKARLFDVVSFRGIVKLCESCLKKENMPVLRKPTTFQLKEAERDSGTYRQGVKEFLKLPKKNEETEKTETTLRGIVDKNYEVMHNQEAKPRPDLVDNFHWILMRARRLKKLTQKDLAKELSESESAIKMAEKGILPEDDYRLVNKLESFLGVKIIRLDVPVVPREEPARVIKFDKDSMSELTIADLKDMKDAEETEVEIIEGAEEEKQEESEYGKDLEEIQEEEEEKDDFTF